VLNIGEDMNKFAKLLVIIFMFLNINNDSFAQNIDELLAALPSAKFSEKEVLVSKLGDLKTETSIKVLKSLEKGTLYFLRSSKKVIYADKTEEGYILTDILTSEIIGKVKKKEIFKIFVNIIKL